MSMKTIFEEFELSLKLTADRTEQDAILDQWLTYQGSVEVESKLMRRYDPETWGRRARATLEPSVGRRARFI